MIVFVPFAKTKKRSKIATKRKKAEAGKWRHRLRRCLKKSKV